MEFKSLTVNLMVADVQRSMDFYCRSFGFEAITVVPGDRELVFALLKLDGVSLMLQSMKSFVESNPDYEKMPIGGTILLYIDVTGIRQVHRKARNAGVTFVRGLHETFYGTMEFTIADCDGYLVSFAEDKNGFAS